MMLTNTQEIKDWLDKYNIEDYSINPDLSVDTNGSVNLDNKFLREIPVQFNHVHGFFNCSNNELTSLKGCPNYVGKYFFCFVNQLTTLEHCPRIIRGVFSCSNNQLTSLEHCPEFVGKDIGCIGNEILSLEHLATEFKGKLHFRNKSNNHFPLFEGFYDANNTLLIKQKELRVILLKNKIEGQLPDVGTNNKSLKI